MGLTLFSSGLLYWYSFPSQQVWENIKNSIYNLNLVKKDQCSVKTNSEFKNKKNSKLHNLTIHNWVNYQRNIKVKAKILNIKLSTKVVNETMFTPITTRPSKSMGNLMEYQVYQGAMVTYVNCIRMKGKQNQIYIYVLPYMFYHTCLTSVCCFFYC